MSVGWRFTEFAERLLRGRLQLELLRGKRGETLPPLRTLMRITSFLQYENFGEIVLRQAGEGAETDPNVVIQSWGNPGLLYEIEGIRFYGR
jgi:hypothetical protein